MKKLLLLLFLVGQLCYAQQVEILSINPIEQTSDGGFYYPVFSPENQFLVATDASYNGLKLIRLTDNSIQTITTDQGAGYGARINVDGSAIVFRKTEIIKGLKYNSLHSITLKNNKQKKLISRTREQFTATFSATTPVFVKGAKLNKKTISATLIAPIIQIEDRKMVVYSGKTRTTLTPNGENASYIWPSLSPDNKRIVYSVAGKGTFVCDITGKNVQPIGKLSAPKWLNNQLLVGMDDKDNGDQTVSSVVIVASADGKNRQALTNANDFNAMYPVASADGKKIAFCTDKGRLYLININIK